MTEAEWIVAHMSGRELDDFIRRGNVERVPAESVARWILWQRDRMAQPKITLEGLADRKVLAHEMRDIGAAVGQIALGLGVSSDTVRQYLMPVDKLAALRLRKRENQRRLRARRRRRIETTWVLAKVA